MLNGIFYRGDGADDSLGVGHLLVGVKGNIEIYLINVSVGSGHDTKSTKGHQMIRPSPRAYPDENPLVFQVHVSDGKLVGKRHCESFLGVFLKNGSYSGVFQ